ncbi:MAG: GNAT family N-acetyltransferase [Burkholderiaceae bacterium]
MSQTARVTTVHIRRAVAEDVEELSSLALRAKAHWGYAVAQLEEWRSSLEMSREILLARPTFVGEINRRIIGFYSLVPSATAWELDNLWVALEYMRLGFRRALLVHAAQTAAASGASSIVIDPDPNAERLYVACGATRVGEVAAPIAGQPNRVRPQLMLAATRSNIAFKSRRSASAA